MTLPRLHRSTLTSRTTRPAATRRHRSRPRRHHPAHRPSARLSPRVRALDRGMTTAEYAVGTLAACAFAAVLIAVVRSGGVRAALTNLIMSALSIAS